MVPGGDMNEGDPGSDMSESMVISRHNHKLLTLKPPPWKFRCRSDVAIGSPLSVSGMPIIRQ
jgi:hypothetical protein